MPPITILALPNELLAEISLFYVAQNLTRYRKYTYHWFLIAHICRRWREAVLQTPHIWAYIIFGYSTACLRTVLERSGQVPLTVVDRHSSIWMLVDDFSSWKVWKDSDALAVVKSVYKELPRIKTFELKYVPEGFTVYALLMATLETTGLTDAPELETLTIRSCLNPWRDRFTSVPIFSKRDRASLPRLRNLTVAGCSRSVLESVLRHHLTSLTLTDVREDGHCSVDVMVGLLRQIPLLEELRIRKSLHELPEDQVHPWSTSSGVDSHDKVILHHLRNIELADGHGGSASASLLDHITFPESTAIAIRTLQPCDPYDFLWILRVLSYKMSAAPHVPEFDVETTRSSPVFRDLYTTCAISCEPSVGWLRFDFRCCERRCEPDWAVNLNTPCPHTSAPPLRIDVCISAPDDSNMFLYILLKDMFPISMVQNLTMDHPLIDERIWEKIIRQMPELRTISVTGDYSSQLFFTALDNVLNKDRLDDPSVFYPDVVRSVYLSSRRETGDGRSGRTQNAAPRPSILPRLQKIKVADANWCRHGDSEYSASLCS